MQESKIVIFSYINKSTLQREKIGKKLSDIIKEMPIEKLDGLEKYLEDYAKKESRPED